MHSQLRTTRVYVYDVCVYVCANALLLRQYMRMRARPSRSTQHANGDPVSCVVQCPVSSVRRHIPHTATQSARAATNAKTAVPRVRQVLSAQAAINAKVKSGALARRCSIWYLLSVVVFECVRVCVSLVYACMECGMTI